MSTTDTTPALLQALHDRRSYRHFTAAPVDPALVRAVVAAGCAAPAPHHTRPWRFATLADRDRRARLAAAMEASWRADLTRDGVPAAVIDKALARSRRRVVGAPALLLGAAVAEGLRAWPDERRATAEWLMAVQSFGAGLQNVLLAAGALGLAAYWMSAPLFCPDVVRDTLALPADWQPQAFIALGWPQAGTPGPRPPLDLTVHFLER